MENTEECLSGLGKGSAVPEEIKKWSWGAFLLNWIWGIGNSTYIALLMFIPFVNIVMIFVLGAKGNQWAWQNRVWRDVEHFKKTQRKWAISGLILVVVLPSLFVFSIFSMLKGDAYKQSLALVHANTEVVAFVGEPIVSSYFVSGSIKYNGNHGNANIQYTITGSKKEATVYVVAHKDVEWLLDKVIVFNNSEKVKIELLKKSEIGE